MTYGNSSEVTVRGLVMPVEWDVCEIAEVSLVTDDEDEYLLEAHDDDTGMELLRWLNAEVEVTGVIGGDELYGKTLTVSRFEVIQKKIDSVEVY